MQKFHCIIATTAQQIRDAQRLRWTVYGEEEGLLLGSTPFDGRETDARDYCEGTTHLLVYDGQELAGTVRLLEPRGSFGLDLAAKFDLGALSAPGIAPAEVTRFCVLRRYRCTGVTSALFSGLYAESVDGLADPQISAAHVVAASPSVAGREVHRSPGRP